jgi:hypothetical protein
MNSPSPSAAPPIAPLAGTSSSAGSSRNEIRSRLDGNQDGEIDGFEHDLFLESSPAFQNTPPPSPPPGRVAELFPRSEVENTRVRVDLLNPAGDAGGATRRDAATLSYLRASGSNSESETESTFAADA